MTTKPPFSVLVCTIIDKAALALLKNHCFVEEIYQPDIETIKEKLPHFDALIVGQSLSISAELFVGVHPFIGAGGLVGMRR